MNVEAKNAKCFIKLLERKMNEIAEASIELEDYFLTKRYDDAYDVVLRLTEELESFEGCKRRYELMNEYA
jgi:hypothetical protein